MKRTDAEWQIFQNSCESRHGKNATVPFEYFVKKSIVTGHRYFAFSFGTTVVDNWKIGFPEGLRNAPFEAMPQWKLLKNKMPSKFHGSFKIEVTCDELVSAFKDRTKHFRGMWSAFKEKDERTGENAEEEQQREVLNDWLVLEKSCAYFVKKVADFVDADRKQRCKSVPSSGANDLTCAPVQVPTSLKLVTYLHSPIYYRKPESKEIHKRWHKTTSCVCRLLSCVFVVWVAVFGIIYLFSQCAPFSDCCCCASLCCPTLNAAAFWALGITAVFFLIVSPLIRIYQNDMPAM